MQCMTNGEEDKKNLPSTAIGVTAKIVIKLRTSLQEDFLKMHPPKNPFCSPVFTKPLFPCQAKNKKCIWDKSSLNGNDVRHLSI